MAEGEQARCWSVLWLRSKCQSNRRKINGRLITLWPQYLSIYGGSRQDPNRLWRFSITRRPSASPRIASINTGREWWCQRTPSLSQDSLQWAADGSTEQTMGLAMTRMRLRLDLEDQDKQIQESYLEYLRAHHSPHHICAQDLPTWLFCNGYGFHAWSGGVMENPISRDLQVMICRQGSQDWTRDCIGLY